MPVGERYVTEGVRIDCELIGGIELYLIAFVQLRSVFTFRELNELGDSMAERGIRLREGLDEALEGSAEASGRDASKTPPKINFCDRRLGGRFSLFSSFATVLSVM